MEVVTDLLKIIAFFILLQAQVLFLFIDLFIISNHAKIYSVVHHCFSETVLIKTFK